ncbi:uncharacterized protein [Amphiura filiformis]|uniref:uncharacterized protein n=1 Tax=Amphiura filiformis TaxID=82378 RepID=UPI003B224624
MENFYGQLQDVLDKIPSKDMLIILGDWNAKVCKCDIKSRLIGKFRLGERNDRGDSLEEFCQANDLIVGNTFFQQHPRRLWTWWSPWGNVKNQIDYGWRSSLFSVRTRPGADCGSDHHLLVARMKLKLKAKKRVTPPVRFDVDKIPEQYTVSVGHRFEALLRTDEEELSPNELWEEMKEAVLSAAEENITKKKKKKQPWISKNTMELADKRQEARKKRRFARMEETTQRKSEDIKTRWAEYCTELYEQKAEEEPTINDSGEIDPEPPPLLDEVRKSMKEIKIGNHQAVMRFQVNSGRPLVSKV